MARYRVTIASPRTPEEVFDYMAKFSNVKVWDPTAVKAHAVDGAEPGQGTTYHVVVRWLGREIPLDYVTTEFKRPRRVVLRAENSSTISEDTITVEPADGGCEMTYEAHLTVKGAMRLLEPLFGLLLKRLGDNAADGLRRELGE
ncbi:MAG TPA: SRPBCC family protein [Dehalococcoidia bacterium]